MKSAVWLIVLILLAAAAVLLGAGIERHDVSATSAVIVGVVLGLAAGIPASLLLWAVVTGMSRIATPSPTHTIERRILYVVGDDDLREPPMLEAEWTRQS